MKNLQPNKFLILLFSACLCTLFIEPTWGSKSTESKEAQEIFIIIDDPKLPRNDQATNRHINDLLDAINAEGDKESKGFVTELHTRLKKLVLSEREAETASGQNTIENYHLIMGKISGSQRWQTLSSAHEEYLRTGESAHIAKIVAKYQKSYDELISMGDAEFKALVKNKPILVLLKLTPSVLIDELPRGGYEASDIMPQYEAAIVMLAKGYMMPLTLEERGALFVHFKGQKRPFIFVEFEDAFKNDFTKPSDRAFKSFRVVVIELLKQKPGLQKIYEEKSLKVGQSK